MDEDLAKDTSTADECAAKDTSTADEVVAESVAGEACDGGGWRAAVRGGARRRRSRQPKPTPRLAVGARSPETQLFRRSEAWMLAEDVALVSEAAIVVCPPPGARGGKESLIFTRHF